MSIVKFAIKFTVSNVCTLLTLGKLVNKKLTKNIKNGLLPIKIWECVRIVASELRKREDVLT